MRMQFNSRDNGKYTMLSGDTQLGPGQIIALKLKEEDMSGCELAMVLSLPAPDHCFMLVSLDGHCWSEAKVNPGARTSVTIDELKGQWMDDYEFYELSICDLHWRLKLDEQN